MFRYYLSKFLLYIWSLLLVSGILSILMGLRGWFVLYDLKKLNPILTISDIWKISLITIVVGFVIILFCALTRKYITKLRVSGLSSARYDEYGRLKGQSDYYELSLAAQKKIDDERKKKMNSVLSISEVKQLTHQGSVNPEGDMEQLVGLDDVKYKMEEMVAQLEFNIKHKIKNISSTLHMNMYGPPGTGKTTVARIMTGFLYRSHYIKRNEIIEVSGSFLTTPDAAIKTEALCQHAYGGILFIDEAYAMTSSSYGQEAIATLIKEMEDSKDKFVLILAGYEREMNLLLNSNPGFLSRIKERFYFRDYNLEELEIIFENMADHLNFKLTESAVATFKTVINRMMKEPNFGNVRTCRNILDKSISKHAYHVKKGLSLDDFVLDSIDISF